MPSSQIAEARRLAVLESYAVLDTEAEEGFDDLVHLASQICETPVSLISLIDAERVWFKARVGFEPPQTSRDQSVCAYAIKQRGLFVIPDLSQDERTKHNTLVTQDPHIRFYAGVVLETPEGECLGTLCTIDRQPRPEGLTPLQARALQALAARS